MHCVELKPLHSAIHKFENVLLLLQHTGPYINGHIHGFIILSLNIH